MLLEKNTTDVASDESSLIGSILDDLANLPDQDIQSTKTRNTISKPQTSFSLNDIKESERLFGTHAQDPAEHTIVGLEALETYVTWTNQTLLALENAQDDTVRNEILAHAPKRIQEKEMANKKPSEAHINLDQISERLSRIEEKIHSLDDTRPEYVEERAALERKKVYIRAEEEKNILQTNQQETLPIPTPTISEKEQQHKVVQDLLNKTSFEYIAPVISPIKEEAARLKKAEEAQRLDSLKESEVKPSSVPVDTKPVQEKKPNGKVTLTPLERAFLIREAFITKLQTTPRAVWYESPSQNRDYVNEQVLTVAQILSGKAPKDINMNDIQTARIFLFDEASEDILKHPAFSYVESFYNYQNKQGYAGEDIKKITAGAKMPASIESPYMTSTPSVVAPNAVKSPFVENISQTKRIVPSPFINLNNTKKRSDENGAEFSI